MDYDILLKTLKEKAIEDNEEEIDENVEFQEEEWKVTFDDMDMADMMIDDGIYPYGSYKGVPVCNLTFKGSFESVLLQFDKYFTEKRREFLLKKYGKEHIEFIENNLENLKKKDKKTLRLFNQFTNKLNIEEYGFESYLKVIFDRIQEIKSDINTNEQFLDLFTKENKHTDIWFTKL